MGRSVLVKRIIPCLDVDRGRVVKGINFNGLRDAGDPVELGKRYCEEGADELVFLDISASIEMRDTMRKVVRAVAYELNIPFTVGGGIRSVRDAKVVLGNGADKVSINTSAVDNPSLICELSRIFGRQCVVVAIDAKRVYEEDPYRVLVETGSGTCWFEVHTYGGREATGLDALKWAEETERLGAGELLVTSMDRDGTEHGYDVELTKAISERVNIPVIASGGAGIPEHFLEIFRYGRADAALAASVFHYSKYPVFTIKKYLRERGLEIRL